MFIVLAESNDCLKYFPDIIAPVVEAAIPYVGSFGCVSAVGACRQHPCRTVLGTGPSETLQPVPRRTGLM
jgi:hypothetical protein